MEMLLTRKPSIPEILSLVYASQTHTDLWGWNPGYPWRFQIPILEICQNMSE